MRDAVAPLGPSLIWEETREGRLRFEPNHTMMRVTKNSSPVRQHGMQ